MEGDLRESPHLGYPVDIADAKYVSGLSTILVATIQEAKDRISQIEDIFCSQLFPNFQSNSKSIQKIYSEARKFAEGTWKEKEKDLLIQTEKLQFEKQLALEENQSLKLEKAKIEKIESMSPNCISKLQDELKEKTEDVAEGMEIQCNLLGLLESEASLVRHNRKLVKELEEKNHQLLKKSRGLELEAEEVRWELMKKSKEVDGGMELHNKLLHLVQSKDSLVAQKEKQLQVHEEMTAELSAKLKNVEKKVDGLQLELGEKTEQVKMGKELQQNLLIKIESQASEKVKNEELLNVYEKENRVPGGKVEILEDKVDGLRKELEKKTEEVVEGRKMQEKLLQQIDLNGSHMLKTGLELEELQKEKRVLLVKLESLETKVGELQVDLRERSNEAAEGIELHGKLLQQIEAKAIELLSEKKKRKEAIDAYKNLKSQYNYLRDKSGLAVENYPHNRAEAVSDPSSHDQTQLISPGTEKKLPDASLVACELLKQNANQENAKDKKRFGSVVQLCPISPSSSISPMAPRYPSNGKSLAGTKRPISHWRDTRSHQNRGAPDPHDDFLDTPLDNIRGNLKKAMKEEVQDLPGRAPKDMTFDSSDDETQDINADPGRQHKKMLPPKPEARGYKYVEPVRKKVDRDALKGIECKQCKKFYDAVLADGDGKDIDGTKQNLRCEHHDGVSRHRYRYAPPLTPEGFWNIGFESEL
ncbi:hypothetical protein RJ639_004330 [Escallonia herrerae]|uniref:DNA endonuclease activator Ctp1 C-terminal domain-containing protein n=1 Tax=Escallonia herrerae TaxID=1293975 RepID=A0AA88W2G1_9ASTE|nr:hypothetical protein RJ639_004330 [Escallonia herrerae]